MGCPILILGDSGSGKSASLRNLNTAQTLLFQAIKKPLPFKSSGFSPVVTDDWSKIVHWMPAAKQKGKNVIILDDFQYLMANEFMRRSAERGFDKFTEIGLHAWSIINAAMALDDDMRVYILSHTETNESGRTKIKTIGKMLDEKITLEGMFTIVLRAIAQDGKHYFSTQNNGNDTVKSPMGMFDNSLIDNDLALVDDAICEYYDLPKQEKCK